VNATDNPDQRIERLGYMTDYRGTIRYSFDLSLAGRASLLLVRTLLRSQQQSREHSESFYFRRLDRGVGKMGANR
jgi:hypothetical protein